MKSPGEVSGEGSWEEFFSFLPLKNSIERDLKKSEERNLAKFSWKFSVIFWLSWALNCHASTRIVSIRARLLLKMSKSKRTRKHTLGRFSLSLSHPIVVTILRENFAISKAKDFLNLVNYLKINFIMQNLSLMFHARMIHGSIHISSNILQFSNSFSGESFYNFIHSNTNSFVACYVIYKCSPLRTSWKEFKLTRVGRKNDVKTVEDFKGFRLKQSSSKRVYWRLWGAFEFSKKLMIQRFFFYFLKPLYSLIQ